jgi:hypothetical protein
MCCKLQRLGQTVMRTVSCYHILLWGVSGEQFNVMGVILRANSNAETAVTLREF